MKTNKHPSNVSRMNKERQPAYPHQPPSPVSDKNEGSSQRLQSARLPGKCPGIGGSNIQPYFTSQTRAHKRRSKILVSLCEYR